MDNLIKRILEKEGISFNNITKATSGFTNIVYFVDNMVIKIAEDESTKKKLLKEISIYENIKLQNIPKYISSGLFDNYLYLIISKVEGKGLYSIWHKLNDVQREDSIRKICETLREFHKQESNFLSNDYKIYDWEKDILNKLENIKNKLIGLGIDTNKIDKAMKNKTLFNDNRYSLIYNDAHFDNFLYDNGSLFLIDFDRVIYAPIDYELLIFKTMCDNPSKFASEEDEDKIFEEDFINIYAWFKKYYNEMFNIPNIDKRIKIYQFIYLCNQALNMKNQEIGNKWAQELVNKLEL